MEKRNSSWGCLIAVTILVSVLGGSTVTNANVVLIGRNISLSFDDIEANFAPPVKGSGICGTLHLAKPLDSCSPLTNVVQQDGNSTSPFILIIRGGCSFKDKVKRAQKAGFKAAIVYDNEDNGFLVSMAGNSAGIKIHAVFVSKASGEILKKHIGDADMELWIIPNFQNSAWSIVAISFISLLAVSALLATCFFVRRSYIRREHPQDACIREFHGMSKRLVKAMPSLIFTSVLEDNCTSITCAICLEDYSVGEKLRILPCRHKFHAICVDAWLTTWRTFCPVCKRDARTSTSNPPASERTPLLSASPSLLASSSVLSSFRSSVPSASALHVSAASFHSLSMSRSRSFARTPNGQWSFRSYHQSSPINISRSSVDLRNASSQRSQASYMVSPHSRGYRSASFPLNSRYISPDAIQSPINASSNIFGSSSYQQHHHPLGCSESANSLSPFASANSLPEC